MSRSREVARDRMLAGLVGEFEKPRFFRYKESLCAHARSRIEGCTKSSIDTVLQLWHRTRPGITRVIFENRRKPEIYVCGTLGQRRFWTISAYDCQRVRYRNIMGYGL